MKALVFAAGYGTRLGEITRTLPKALVPAGGVPMLQRVIFKLRDAGFREIVVNACHLADKIQRFLEDNGNFGMDIKLSLEPGPEPFETGGGIKFARPLLEDGEPFLAYNVDILSDADLRGFVSSARRDALATLLVREPSPKDNRFFLFDSDMRLAGWTNVTTGEVRGRISRAGDYRRMSFCGIHLISQQVFPLLQDWPERFSITDFYIKEAAEHPVYGVSAGALNLIDIGSPASLAEADAYFSRMYTSSPGSAKP